MAQSCKRNWFDIRLKRCKKMRRVQLDSPEDKAIRKWMDAYALQRHSKYSYLTIRAFEECELDGCAKFRVHWLMLDDIKEADIYLDLTTHEIIHTKRYI